MSRYIFIGAIFTLLFSAFSMILNHQGFAEKVLVIFFWLALTGGIVYLFEVYEK